MSHTLLDRYEREYVKYHKISDHRWRQQRKLLLEFEEQCEAGKLEEATYADLQGFAGEMIDSGLHVNTVRKKLNMIRPFYSWAYAAGVVTPAQYLSLRNVKDPRGSSGESDPKPYTRPELRRFWEELDAEWPILPTSGIGSRAISRWERGKGPWRPVWKHAMRLQLTAMVRLALDCGLRKGEILRLSLDDLHYDNEYIVVWRAAKGKKAVFEKQMVPITTDARQAVYTWLEFRAKMKPGHERPWVSCYGAAYTEPMSLKRMGNILATVGDWEWHRFRHTCATEWLRSGMKLEYVSKLLGHATLQQTMCYAKIVEQDLIREVERHEADFSQAVSRAA